MRRIVYSLLMILLAGQNSYSADRPVPTRYIALPESTDLTRYRLCPLINSHSYSIFGDHFIVDYNADGKYEYADIYSDKMNDGSNKSAVVGFRSINGEVQFQYNGWLQFANVWGAQVMDVIGGPGQDIIVPCQKKDTVVMEIIGYDSTGALISDTTVIAIARKPWFKGEWQNIHVHLLASIDLNNDGHKEILFNVSAKPDSAVERGVTAFDITNNQVIWKYAVADQVGPANFHILRNSHNDSILAFCAGACNNLYQTNGLDSQHGYVIGLNLKGEELWRQCIGGPGFLYPQITHLDINNDGVDEVLAPFYERSTPEADSIYIAAIDISTGEKIISSSVFAGDHLSLFVYGNKKQNNEKIIAHVRKNNSGYAYMMDHSLNIYEIVSTPFYTVYDMFDLTGDGFDEMVWPLGGEDMGFAVTDSNLNILAYCYHINYGTTCFRENDRSLIFCNMLKYGFAVFALEKRPILEYIFNNYKWSLAVIAAILILYSLIKLTTWITGLYLSSAGLLSLDKINAIVVILNRRGKIIYANKNPLVAKLVGQPLKNWTRYEKSALSAFPALIEIINKSFLDPQSPIQTQIDIPSPNIQDHKKIEIIIYPRLNKSNLFTGKIIIIEDISERADWKRKVVLGEAAQKWIHRLKGNMATAKIILENIREDQRLWPATVNREILEKYIGSLESSILETGEVTSRILNFIRITKPDMIPFDINSIINKAIEPYLIKINADISVVKKLQPDLPKIMIDPDQMAEVIDNLISNSFKAIGQKGIITITTELAGKLPSKNSELIYITVEDNGRGIDKKDLDRIFEPGFSRLPNGTGIGLAIVREILNNHKAEIAVTSEPGQGSRFIISLPGNNDEKHYGK